MKTNRILKPVPLEEKAEIPQFAIDEPYKKPTHKMPYFEDISKQPKEIGAVRTRLNELKKGRRVREVVIERRWWEVWK